MDSDIKLSRTFYFVLGLTCMLSLFTIAITAKNPALYAAGCAVIGVTAWFTNLILIIYDDYKRWMNAKYEIDLKNRDAWEAVHVREREADREFLRNKDKES